MPRLEHEPWCETHEFGVGDEVGMCWSVSIDFGPLDADCPLYGRDDPSPFGCVSAQRLGGEPLGVYVDYRTVSGGEMDVNALRAVREAVAESPAEFLDALDRLIECLGDGVPRRSVSLERRG